MKLTLTIEESQRLIELGVDAKLASWREFVDKTEEDPNQFLKIEELPRFTLTDILAILPKEIKTDDSVMGADFICTLRMNWDAEWKMWHTGYTALPRPAEVGIAPELIDALYQLLIWCIDNRHINLKEK